MRFHTVLIVDDYEPFRRLIRLTLSQRTDFQVIGEASDGGAEALEKAQELQPDLILMDLGLPRLNGMEATKRLRTLVPHARILIISWESSSDVVHESLRLGAAGYVHKPDVHSELLAAIEAALARKQFLSRGIPADREGGGRTQSRFCHEVQFYSDDSIFLDCVVRFLAAALKTGGAAIAIATRLHRESIVQGLDARGVDVDTAIREGRHIPLDAADTLSTFMVDGWPDPVRFLEGSRTLIESVSKAIKVRGSRVAIFGEGVALLWAEGKTEAAIRLEQLVSNLAETHSVDTLCAYPFSLQIEEDEDAFSRICAAHSAVYSR